MRIAVDAMGGDYAPAEIVKGALAALERDGSLHVVLVGQEDEIKKHLPDGWAKNSRLSIFHCREVIGMHEYPATAYRKKKDASITVATRLVKENEAQAVVSAGSTGAQMVAALFGLGRMEGVDRPAILIILPTLKGPALLLDGGANADCKPGHLVQFAKMGTVYAKKVLGMNNPRVGLLNIGEEAAKGNELTVKAYELLASDGDLNFMGNIEGRDILSGKSEVIVCDGFVGNIALKIIEGTAGTIMALLKEEMTASLWRKAGALMLKPGLKRLKERLDYAEYGGMPLLGVKGVSIICHGSSRAKAIMNAIVAARNCVNSNFIGELEKSFEKR